MHWDGMWRGYQVKRKVRAPVRRHRPQHPAEDPSLPDDMRLDRDALDRHLVPLSASYVKAVHTTGVTGTWSGYWLRWPHDVPGEVDACHSE